MREKIERYQKRLQKIKIEQLNDPLTRKILDELREETNELAAILAAQIALEEGKDSPIRTLIKHSKNKNDLASRIQKKIT